MLTVKPEKNDTAVELLYNKNNLPYLHSECMAVVAKQDEETLGYCLFSVKENICTIHFLEPLGDFFLADGILRSALHVALCNGATDAFYDNDILTEFLKKDAFLKAGDSNALNIQKLYSSCCSCEKN